MNKYIETKIREAARKFAGNKKAPSQPETQFRKGAEWMYELLTDGQTASAYREQLCQDVKNREGKTEVDVWKLSLINELADMLAERDAMMVTIREEGRLVTKWDKAGNMYKESNPLYVHVKAKEQSISVWRDKLGLSNTVNPDRIKQDAKAGSERETDQLFKYTDTILGR